VGCRMCTELNKDTVEYYLIQLGVFGNPSINLTKEGWMCKVESVTLPRGVSLSITSEVTHPTALAAASECTKRMRRVISTIIEP
jgi:hypothetical protein